MERRPSVNCRAELGWAAIAGFVVLFDCLASETLSEGVDRALVRHPLATTTAIGVTALHLLNVLPPAVDPFHHAVRVARGTGNAA